jgi:hypothetical protein
MYPSSSNGYNSTQSGGSNLPATSDPLTAFAVLVVFGLLVLVLAVTFRWCMPGAVGNSELATDERHERQRKRLDYIHKVLKTHPWHGTGSGDGDNDKERDTKDGPAARPPLDRTNASPTLAITDSLTIPSGCDDTISRQGKSGQRARQSTPWNGNGNGEADEAAASSPRGSLEDPTGADVPRGGALAALPSFASGSAPPPDGDGGAPECAICLCRFAEGEVVCESNNPLCHHAYHRDCLEPWLLRHERCPVCREVYLGRPGGGPARSRAPEGGRAGAAAAPDNAAAVHAAVAARARPPGAATAASYSGYHLRFGLR